MIGGEMGDGAVVCFEPGEGGDEARGADIDNWQRNAAQRRSDRIVFDASDDAMPIPMGEPARGLVATVVFRKVKRPGAMFANVGNNAAQEPARVCVRSL